VLQEFFQTVKENQTLLAALGLGSAGIITFWLKDVPRLILQLLKRELTTSLTVTNQNIAFYNILKWVSVKYKNKNFRYLKLTNGKWGEEKENTLSIGYGTHFMFYKYHFWVVRMVKEEANQSYHDKEYIEITKLGRDKKIFDVFLEDVRVCENDKNVVKLYRFNENWEYIRTQNKRSFDTVFIEKEKKDLLLKRVDKFITGEDWYIKNGIPYQLGILLYGPPGTGKTSIIKALASYLNYPIYNIQTSKFLKIEEAFESLSEKCLVVVEDIDCQKATHTRDEENGENDTPTLYKNKNGDTVSAIGLAEILNALDGVCNTDGRVLVATTNYIEKLDSALIRPGRFDIKIKVDYLNSETFSQFVKRFFPNECSNHINDIAIKNNIPMSVLQEMLISGSTFKEFVEVVSEK
jgi:chaperone BCS1